MYLILVLDLFVAPSAMSCCELPLLERYNGFIFQNIQYE